MPRVIWRGFAFNVPSPSILARLRQEGTRTRPYPTLLSWRLNSGRFAARKTMIVGPRLHKRLDLR